MAIFLTWLVTAQLIYSATFGGVTPVSLGGFVADILTTQQGWTLIVVGNAVGFLFALVAFTISVVSFPLLLDRDVGFAAAVATSARAVVANPFTMALWGLIVAAALAIGSLPLLIGLAVVMPVLGHSTWHLYRKVVERARQRSTARLSRAAQGKKIRGGFSRRALSLVEGGSILEIVRGWTRACEEALRPLPRQFAAKQ
jgi:uncharacterized membrane protein